MRNKNINILIKHFSDQGFKGIIKSALKHALVFVFNKGLSNSCIALIASFRFFASF
jgi:hypothetical protein